MHEVGECLRRLRDARDDARSQLALAQRHVDALGRSLFVTSEACDSARARADALEEVRVSLVANVEDYRERCEAIARERDDARAEVERLRSLLPPSAHTGVRNGPGEGSWAVFAEKVVAERDELRHKLAGEAAHIRSLEDLLVEATRERDSARAEVSRREREHDALVETSQKALESVAAERDEARAERDEARAHTSAAAFMRVERQRDEARAQVKAWQAEELSRRTERDEARAEVERLREALRAIAAGFDTITGSVDDPSAKQVDGYFRGYAMAALERAAQR